MPGPAWMGNRRHGGAKGQARGRTRPARRSDGRPGCRGNLPYNAFMRPLVVIPTYNESENIERMLHRIHECLPGAGVLVVDDGSPDGTADLVKRVAAELPDVHLLARGVEVRLGSVYRAGSPGVSSAVTTPASRSTPTSPTTPPRCRRWWRR